MSYKKEEELALLEGPGELLKVVQLYLNKQDWDDALRVANDTLELARDIEDEDAKSLALEVITKVHLAQGDFDGAVDAVQEAVEFYKDEEDVQGKAGAQSMLAKMYLEKGDFKKALAAAQESADACEECSYPEGKAIAFSLLTKAHMDAGNTSDALEASQQWLATLKETGNKEGEAEALDSLVKLHLRMGDSKASLQLAKEAAVIFKEAGNKKKEAGVILTQAKIYGSRDLPDQALKTASAALKLIREDGNDVEGEVEALYAVMSAQEAMDDGAKALDTAAEVLNLFRDGRKVDKRMESKANVTVAKLLLKLGDPITAAQVAEEARGLLHEIDSKEEGSLLLEVIVEAHLMSGNTQLALASAEDAVVLARLSSDNLAEANALQCMARIRLELGELEEALQAANEMVAVYSLTNDELQQAEAQHMVAHIESMKGAQEIALSSADAALGLFRRVQNRQGEASVLETVAQIQQARERFAEALKASEEASAIYLELGDRSRATASSQSIAAIRFGNDEAKEVLKEAKTAVSRCREKGDKHAEAQQHLLIACAQLEIVSKTVPMDITPSKVVPTKRLMEALMAGKEALELFRDTNDQVGEAAALQAIAKTYRYKQEPILAIEWAKQATVANKAIGDWYAAASALMLEATTFLMMLGSENFQVKDSRGGLRAAKPAEEALCAAQDGVALFQTLGDPDVLDWAERVLQAAQSAVDSGKAAAKPARVVAEEDQENVAPFEDPRADPFAKMGYDFQTQAEVDKFLQRDPRERGLRLKCFQWTPARDPMMDKLVSAMGRAKR